MPQDLSIVQLLLHASWVVQAVVALLVLVSVISWAAIFRKVFNLKRVNHHNEDFEKEFWSGTNLNDLYSAAAQSARHGGPTWPKRCSRLSQGTECRTEARR